MVSCSDDGTLKIWACRKDAGRGALGWLLGGAWARQGRGAECSTCHSCAYSLFVPPTKWPRSCYVALPVIVATRTQPMPSHPTPLQASCAGSCCPH